MWVYCNNCQFIGGRARMRHCEQHCALYYTLLCASSVEYIVSQCVYRLTLRDNQRSSRRTRQCEMWKRKGKLHSQALIRTVGNSSRLNKSCNQRAEPSFERAMRDRLIKSSPAEHTVVTNIKLKHRLNDVLNKKKEGGKLKMANGNVRCVHVLNVSVHIWRRFVCLVSVFCQPPPTVHTR